MTFIRMALVLSLAILFHSPARAQNLDQIGVTLLRTLTTNLNGTGIRVAQPEAELGTDWEVDPTVLGQPDSKFSYFSSVGSTNGYPNFVGTNSWHAEWVGSNFYSVAFGVATNIGHVDNFEADYFFNSIVSGTPPSNIDDAIANQSFIFGTVPVSTQQQIDSAYDNYAVQFNTLFISGAGNGDPVNITPPGTCYNGIGVGVSDSTSSVGPTADNGRSKPDIIAPGGATSFSTPYVAGSAAVLMQAALRGDGGADTNSAADMRTIKTLLLNGAVKPTDWTNSMSAPLDTRYGAGVLNIFNSYKQLAGGKQGYITSASVGTGNPHPPTGASGTISALTAWDFNTISSSLLTDGVNHYYFNVTNSNSNTAFIGTATIAWNRPASISPNVQSGINNLALFLYNAANNNLITASTSLVDNVQHIFIPRLPPGRYDLQVWKAGGSGIVSPSESYALAWSFVSPALSVAKSGTTAQLSWPVYPAGFIVQSATSLTAPSWTANNLPQPSFSTGTNILSVPMTNAVEFFRLREPNY